MPSLASASSPTHHTTMVLALLHKLNASYPSQRAFLELLNDPIPSAPWIRLSATMNAWAHNVARCLRRNDYLTFNELTRRTAIPRLSCSSKSDSSSHISATPDLAKKALYTLLESLRFKARISAWRVLRSAYPQFALPVGDTRTWLSRTLLLDHEIVTSSEGKNGQEGAEKLTKSELELWFTEREKLREVGRKDGFEGRWVVEIKR
ncbi:hypothetical protein HETIRDRAFT_156243 [Heterobasidion irregulare TC 32-1]|uniref:Uncharacterized protein n=1 Tax=Heterobasidion irregulare (strain TC 32-1) TaxID=747525 RepID=W4K6Q7_HETIT|nr:uncharacterized protein HETIRDRAFT_156243 [Heterobasidion irregulare TC 32-1]ETW81517.1 hypothetical protein HETIRDRAFT_156243 [Heterobasidion irregulare TC 32-1]